MYSKETALATYLNILCLLYFPHLPACWSQCPSGSSVSSPPPNWSWSPRRHPSTSTAGALVCAAATSSFCNQISLYNGKQTAENMSTAQCTLNIMWESISHFKLSCKNYSSYYLNYEVINTLFKDEVGKFKVVHTV